MIEELTDCAEDVQENHFKLENYHVKDIAKFGAMIKFFFLQMKKEFIDFSSRNIGDSHCEMLGEFLASPDCPFK